MNHLSFLIATAVLAQPAGPSFEVATDKLAPNQRESNTASQKTGRRRRRAEWSAPTNWRSSHCRAWRRLSLSSDHLSLEAQLAEQQYRLGMGAVRWLHLAPISGASGNCSA
jgi:hypothetical protein